MFAVIIIFVFIKRKLRLNGKIGDINSAESVLGCRQLSL